MWSAYRGAQPGDPAKLGKALVEVARMEWPPKVFVAGSDAAASLVKPYRGSLTTGGDSDEAERSLRPTFPRGPIRPARASSKQYTSGMTHYWQWDK